jgi:hypothetical protein
MLPRIAYRTAVAAASLFLLAPATAGAQSSQGALVERVDECYDFVDYVLCQQGQVVVNYVQAPTSRVSGTTHYDIEVTVRGTETYPCDMAQTTRFNTHSSFELDAGLPDYQEFHNFGRERFSFGCEGGPVTTCEGYSMLHEANGELTFWRFDYGCTEEG